MILLHGDCLELMKTIPDKSIDLVLTDPPYGTTACKWDSVIPFEPMWAQVKRVVKDNGAICLFGSEPFSSFLRLSNLKMYRYDWIWKKTKAPNFLFGNKQPMKLSENIIVFYLKQPTYNSQLQEKCCGVMGGTNVALMTKDIVKNPIKQTYNTKRVGLPKLANNFIEISNGTNKRIHPTQKPVALLEYLIKTYTLEGETVLDFTMGSGSTGVACKNLKRKFIGIELDEKYFEIARERIKGIQIKAQHETLKEIGG